MDQIEGTVAITAQTDTRFDELEIAFMGTPDSNQPIDTIKKLIIYQARQKPSLIAWQLQLQSAVAQKP